jgi:release factor family 2
VKLEPLQHLYHRPGPFLSVYLDRSRTTEDAARILDMRWRQLREQALGEGAGEADVAAVDEALSAEGSVEHTAGRHGRGLVSAGGAILVDEVLDEPPAQDVARWAVLPDLLPLLVGTAGRLPHAIVRVDRLGADITVHAPDSDTSVEVEGDDYPIRKVKPGGWSQRRYQERAENLWEHNAKQVADRLDSLVRRQRPAVVVVAGDVRARGLLREAVSEATAALLVDVEEGGRAADGSEESLRKAIDEVLAARRAERDRKVLDEYREEAGQGDRAVAGLAPTVAALREARVATLVLHPDVDAAQVWVGPEPVHLAVHEDELRGMGVDRAERVAASAGVIRSAVTTDATALVVRDEPALRDGIGAILRYRR